MNILLFGKNGQLGWELQRSLSVLGQVTALSHDSTQLCGDFAQPDAVADTVRALCPAVIVNAAAHTAVDKAESEPDVAMRINGDGTGYVAEIAAELGAPLLHLSTDYVFDGALGRPYRDDAPTGPPSAYGRSKLACQPKIRTLRPTHPNPTRTRLPPSA